MDKMSPQNMAGLANMEKQRERNAELRQEAERRVKVRQEAEKFPPAMISERWRHLVNKAIPTTAPLSQQIPIGDFAEVVAIDPVETEITYWHYGILSNALDAVSPDFLGLSRPEYKDFIKTEVVPGIREWNMKKFKWIQEYAIEVAEEEKAKKIIEAHEKLSADQKNKLAKA